MVQHRTMGDEAMSNPLVTDNHIIDGYTLFKKETDESGLGWKKTLILSDDPSITRADLMDLIRELNFKLDQFVDKLRFV